MLWEDVLVPVRFLTSAGQLLAVLAVALDEEPYLLAALPQPYSQEQYDDVAVNCRTVLGLSIAGLALELFSLIRGYSFFADRANTLHCFLHGAGCAGAALIVLTGAHYGFLWRIFWIAGLPPLLLEACTLLGISWLRTSAY
mmetsp:Transcript_81790/g.210672  ORF Transcript_81790/g.210672 Transcript_81790/m.210672 type:complete len:141 (+) Transcript_81790:136-558(+)